MLSQITTIAIGAVIYSTPSIVAWSTGRRQWNKIFLLNVLLGWTVLDWIVALIWAASTAPDPALGH